MMARRELLEADLAKESWGNLPANLDFLERSGLFDVERQILEIGCGKGALLRRLADAGHDIVGLDHDPNQLSEVARAHPTCCGAATELPFLDDQFDIVIGMDVFEHIPETERHLEEVHRVLRPGGHYVLETPNILFNFPFEMFRNVRRLGWRHMFAFLEPPWHCALHSYWGVKRDFRRGAQGLQPRPHAAAVSYQLFRDCPGLVQGWAHGNAKERSMNLSLDQQTLEMTCPECEEEFLVIRGSVFDAEAPIGLYLLALHGHTPGGPIAHLAIALLDPETEDAESEEGSAAPTAVAMDVVPEDGDFGFVLIDWRDSTWQTESYLGEQIDRGEALEHARKSDFFQVAGYVVRSLPDVTAYLFPDSDAAHGDR